MPPKNRGARGGGGKGGGRPNRAEGGGDSSSEKSANGGTNGVDLEHIQTTLLTRLNETLKETGVSGAGEKTENTTAIMKELIQHILPLIVQTVAAAVGEVIKDVLRTHLPSTSEKGERNTTKRHILLLRYENDRLQQYTRKETVRIVGMKEEQGENLEKKVLSLFKETGVDVAETDLAVVHRTGMKNSNQSRHILARFVSRRKKKEVMMKRKNLKDKDGMKNVFINDDLTTLRSRLLKFMKQSGKFERVWTVEGRILCVKKSTPGAPPDTMVRSAETADDLFHLGFDQIDYEALGLEEYWTAADDL